ncbi:MAG: hypothetical protein EA370_13265 [Wenzhouxiangella sp.]|nr:MAG: hypothetical protein EA370_13265 [Wenzhouxiangella sp.]
MSSFDPDDLVTGLIRVNRAGQVAWLNQAAARMLGRRAREVSGLDLADLSTSLASWRRQVADHGPTIQVSESGLEDSGQPVDVTLQATGEDVLIELHPLSERLRQREMTERADRQQAMTLLTRALAHELRNPLAGVRGAAQLIASGSRDDALRRHANMIQREVDRITALIDDFAGDGEAAMGSTNLHRVLDEAAELVQAEHQGRLNLVRRFDPSIPEILADGNALRQLFLNLLRNAAQAGAGQLSLTSRIEHHSPLVDGPARHAIRIDIDDDGPGVPDQIRDRLFLPLVTGRESGSGFGLAVAQQIARRHAGLIEHIVLVDGCRFRVRLPLIQPRPEQAPHDD